MSRAAVALPIPRPDLRGLLTRNVPLKLAAIGVALIAWLVLAQSQEVEEVTAPFEGKIPVARANVPAGYVLRGSLGTVEVTVRGPTGDLRELAVSSFRAEVDLSQYDLRRGGDLQELPVQVSVAKDPVRVLEVRPSLVATKLVPVEAKRMTVQVRFENQPPTGYQADAPFVAPEEVEVRGPADALREVVSVIVPVRFADAPNDLRVSPRALPVDGAGHEVPDVEVTPQNIGVSVTVQQARPTRTVGVIPVLRGQPTAGFWVASAAADPAVVTVRGEQSALEQVDRVETTPIDVSGASANRVVRASLVLPSGTSLARDAETVLVTIAVRPFVGTRLFPLVAVQPEGLASNLVAEVDPPSVQVVLAGDQPALLAVRSEQVTATVPVGGRGPGTYQLEVSVRSPSGTTVTTVTPKNVSVVLRSRS